MKDVVDNQRMRVWFAENKVGRNVLLVMALFLVALSFRLWDINATGGTWDEISFYRAGKIYVENILAHNFSSDAWRYNYEHPPIGKYIYGIVNYLTKAKVHDYTASRVISAIMGALSCLVVFFAGKEFFGKRVGVLAALILAFTPPFLAHNKIAALESPVALFFALTAYFFLQAIKRKSSGRCFLSAFFCGLAIGSKFNNLLLFVFVFLVFLLHKRQKLFRKEERGLSVAVALFPAIAIAVFVASWPWLWTDTWRHLIQSAIHWASEPTEYFLGRRGGAPVSYYVFYFLATTPAVILVLFGLFMYKAVKNRNLYLSAIALWFAVPFLYSFSSWKQDGIRYIYQIYPPLSLISAVGLFSFIDAVPWKRYKRLISYSLPSAVVFYLLVTCLIIHPYYLDYYNEVVGGPRNVHKQKWFEIGWWGEGIKEAVEYINKSAKPNSWVQFKIVPDHEKPPLDPSLRLYPVPVDKFSVKWKGKLKVNRDDNYVFYTRSDDGVKLWIDGDLLIDDWQDHALKENQDSIVLARGMHDIELQFYENEMRAAIALLWSSGDSAKVVIPSDHLYCTFGPYEGKGLWGQYYNGRNFEDLIMNRVDLEIDFDWESGAPADPEVDYVVVNTFWEWWIEGPFRQDNFEKVYTVDAAGAPLVTVYQRVKKGQDG